MYVLDFPLQNDDGREYIEVQMLDTLTAGVKYRVLFYASLADTMQYAIGTLGCYFSPSKVLSTDMKCLPYIPQIINSPTNLLTDKNNWIAVSDTFTAMGNELYMVMGNFHKDSLSDTTYVGGGGWGIGTSYYYIDDVSVYPDSLTGLNEHGNSYSITLYPNPSNGKFRITSNGRKQLRIELFDMLGNKIYERIGTAEIDISFRPKGVYVLRATNGDTVVCRKVVVE